MNYKSAVLPAGEPLHQRGKHAVAEIQCPPPIPFDQDSLPRYDCAKRLCTECPTYKLIPTKKNATVDDPCNSFHQYKTRYKCSEYDALKKGIKVCQKCERRRKKNVEFKTEGRRKRYRIGRLTSSLALIHYKLPVNEFIEHYYSPHLTKYKWHRFQYTILSKRYITDVRLKTLLKGDLGTQQEFAERCKMEFQGQVQCNYYNGGRVISIEGVAVWLFLTTVAKLRCCFVRICPTGRHKMQLLH